MTTIYHINLPKVPTELYENLLAKCRDLPLNEKDRCWMHEFHNRELSVVSYSSRLLEPDRDALLVQALENYYQKFFKEKCRFLLMRNSNVASIPSTAPPHCDRGRKIAINYLLDTGGDRVITRFYKEKRSTDSLSESENRHHQSLTIDFDMVFGNQTWHAYDVQTFHSIENIWSDRLLLSIILESNPCIDQFVSVYNSLVLDKF